MISRLVRKNVFKVSLRLSPSSPRHWIEIGRRISIGAARTVLPSAQGVCFSTNTLALAQMVYFLCFQAANETSGSFRFFSDANRHPMNY